MLNSKFKFILVIFVFLSTSYYVLSTAHAVTESDCLNKSVSELSQGEMDQCINEILPRIAAAYAPAQEKNKQNLAGLKKQIDSLNARINSISQELKNKEIEIKNREKDTDFAQSILNEKAVSQYITARLYDPLISLISATDALEAFKTIKIKEMVAEGDRKTIEKYSEEIISLKNDKESLEKNKISLASLQKKVSEDAKFLEAEVGKVESFLSVLSSKQSELLVAKSGGFSVSVGDAALTDDYNASLSGWQAKAPSGSITVFSFGAYAGNGSNSRRNGMSQYGAQNRAISGQSVNDILQAYYGATPVSITSPATIATDVGTIPFEKQYLYGISEMPSSWHPNALRAQAIAARTFALRSNKPICTSDKCQVYRASKVGDPSAQAWRDAVNATEGMVLPDGVSAQYVSTPGGYLDTKGWDTKCGNKSCFAAEAWDASSPWFYKAWYTNYKYPTGFSTCKRSDPWLSQTDISDILNAWKVYQDGSVDDKSKILPPDGCGGGSPFSIDEMRSKADSLGGSYSSVSNVNIQQNDGGYTSQVVFSTNIGQVTITGFDTGCSHSSEQCNDFWSIFNLRAPGNISIKNRMFDIRKK